VDVVILDYQQNSDIRDILNIHRRDNKKFSKGQQQHVHRIKGNRKPKKLMEYKPGG
jgi:hypothetical protein